MGLSVTRRVQYTPTNTGRKREMRGKVWALAAFAGLDERSVVRGR